MHRGSTLIPVFTLARQLHYSLTRITARHTYEVGKCSAALRNGGESLR